MSEIFQTITSWLNTFGIKILGILIVFIVLSQMSRWDDTKIYNLTEDEFL